MAYEIIAKSRTLEGTGASRRLRKAGGLPGVVYGGGQEAVSIELDHNALYYVLQEEAFHSSIINLLLDDKKQNVLVRDVQYHPWKQRVLHIDFQRVSADEKIHMRIPLHFLNQETAPGVKLAGGSVNHVLNEVEISCLPKQLPEFIEVDLGAMEVGQTLHLSDIKVAKGIELVALSRGEDLAVVSIAGSRGGSDEAAAASQ
jgi:large subunit ribosomal protein L25